VSDYDTAIEKYILPRWGSTRLVDIRASMVEAWRNELLAGGAGRSPVRKALIVLGRLFRFAKRDHLVAHNPTVDVGKPSVRSRKGEHERLTPGQLKKLFKVVRGRTRVAVQLGARTGMREGEIFGLRWGNVDVQNRVIHVRGQYTHGEFVEFPKTDAGVRDLPVDKELAQVLIKWKLSLPPARQQPDSLVVATPEGTPLNVSNFLSREFYPALKAAELPRVVFHSLRHTYKTILVSTDTPPAVVHSILGHANFATTLKLYGGVTSQALDLASGKTSKTLAARADKNRTNRSD
jgi:integrase